MCTVMERYNAMAAAEAKKKVCKLIQLLFAHNRANDAQRAVSDPAYLEQLFAEFSL